MVGLAREYMPDAIAAVDPDFPVEELADQLTELLTDPDLWQRHHAAANRQARGSSFAHVADELIRTVSSLAANDIETGLRK
jgi:hypothetical protein